MNISQDFSLTASVWDGDKFLIEAATANGSRQMKVTAEVVRAYLNGTAGPSSATDRRVLPFRGFMDSGEISPSSAATALPLEVWFVRSAARFAVAERSSEPVSSSAPPKLYDNWEGPVSTTMASPPQRATSSSASPTTAPTGGRAQSSDPSSPTPPARS